MLTGPKYDENIYRQWTHPEDHVLLHESSQECCLLIFYRLPECFRHAANLITSYRYYYHYCRPNIVSRLFWVVASDRQHTDVSAAGGSRGNVVWCQISVDTSS